MSQHTFEIRMKADDGLPILLRAVRPEDKHRFVEGLARLSPSARFHRFLTPIQRFSAAQLKYLTEVDQVNHVAWGICDRSTLGQPGIGVARFVTGEDEPEVGDIAITVLDEFQGRGMGRLLLAVMSHIAVDQGVRVFRGDVHWRNERVRAWLAGLGASGVRDGKRIVMDLYIDLDGWMAQDDAFGQTLRYLEPLLPLHRKP